MTNQVNARGIVLDMLIEIIEENKYSHTVLNQVLKRYQGIPKQERAFITRLTNGTVKHYLTIDYIINQFASIPVKKMKPLIRNLLRLSVYQIVFMDQVPVSAVCNEAVKLAKKRGFVKLSGFVNGILRNIARNEKQIVYPEKETQPNLYLEVQYSTPEWLVKELLRQYDFDTVEQILAASLKEKETTIRCNQKLISPSALKERLEAGGVEVDEIEYLNYAFKIHGYDYLHKLEEFQLGYFTVQDVSSMLVNEIAAVDCDDYVLDVCAAPGGKAIHAAEKAKFVSARDLTEYKIALIEENIQRMGQTNVEPKVWDATVLDPSVIEQADVVIADLPCSGLGVLGKKPDIKYKVNKEQLDELVELQRTILRVVKDYVKPGGILIYSTCTINKEENVNHFRWFLEENLDFEAVSLDPHLPRGLGTETTKEGYLQLLQGKVPMDGFFISKMRKRKAN